MNEFRIMVTSDMMFFIVGLTDLLLQIISCHAGSPKAKPLMIAALAFYGQVPVIHPTASKH